jgi:hypothetical protein
MGLAMPDDDDDRRHNANITVLVIAAAIVIIGTILMYLLGSSLRTERCLQERRHDCDTSYQR